MLNHLFNNGNSEISPKWKKDLTLFISLVKSKVVSDVNYSSYRYCGCCIHSLQLTDGDLELVIMEDGNIDIPDEKNVRDMIRVGVVTISTTDSVDTQKLISAIVGSHSVNMINKIISAQQLTVGQKILCPIKGDIITITDLVAIF